MAIGLVGRKCGMTRVFTEEGTSIPVSVIEVLPNRIVQIKNQETDGYTAIQITTGQKKLTRVNEPTKGHYAKASVEPGVGLWEFRTELEGSDFAVGKELKVDLFQEGQVVDVQGTTKGKGYAGVIKRHHFATQDATHGNSVSHRAPGSIGQRQTPGRVFKGKRMAGRLGNALRTIQNLKVVKVDQDRHLLLISGSIPGAPGGMVIVRPGIKAKKTGENK